MYRNVITPFWGSAILYTSVSVPILDGTQCDWLVTIERGLVNPKYTVLGQCYTYKQDFFHVTA